MGEDQTNRNEHPDFTVLTDFLASFADLVASPLILVDEKNVLRFASTKAEALLCLPAEEAASVTFQNLMNVVDLGVIQVRSCAGEKRFRYHELPVKWGDASARLLALRPEGSEGDYSHASRDDFNFLLSFLNSSVAIGSIQKAGQFSLIYISPPIQEITGYRFDQFLADTNLWFNMTHLEDRTRLLNYWDEMYSMQDQQTHVLEYRILRSDDQVRWVEDNQTCRFLPSGERRFYSFLTDISSRKHAEEERDQTEERYRLLAETVSDVVSLLDHNGNLIYVSPSVEKVLGYRPEELTGRVWLDCMHPEDREKLMRDFESHMLEGEEHIFEWRGRCKDGNYLWVESRSRAIRIDSGKARGWVCSMREIDSHKKIEKALTDTNRRLQESINELEQRNIESNLINEIGEKFQTCHSQEEVFETLQEYIPKLIKGGRGALYIGQNGSGLFDRQAMWGESNKESPVLTPEFCWSLSRGQVFRVRDARSPMVCRNLEEANTGTRIAPCLCAPIIVQRETLGVITFKEWQSPSFERVEQLAVTLAEKVGMALMNIRLRETLRMQSLRDALTGLFNRRYLDETLERELHRALRTKQTICVVMIDIDHFKKYNDTYGHDAGDALLQLFGKFLQEHVRGSDIACRYGGEEFVVVMPDTALDDSRKRAEQLRVGLKNLTLVYQGKQLEGITVSVGIAVFPEHGLTLRSLLKAADVALYSAKNQGRDCVAVALGKSS